MKGLISPLTKHRIKQVLSSLGIRVRMGHPAAGDLGDFLGRVRGQGYEPGTVFDVGVADGTIELYETFPSARHILVEPMEEFRPSLDFLKKRFGVEYLIAAAAAEDGRGAIWFGDTHAHSLHAASVLSDAAASKATRASRTVPFVRLDTLAAQCHAKPPYLIKADTQGFELSVMGGAEGILKDTDLIILEVSLHRFSPETPLFDEVVAYMKSKGFVVYDLFGGHGRPLDGALAQVDVAFAAEHGRFFSSTLYASPEQREADQKRLVNRLRKRLGV